MNFLEEYNYIYPDVPIETPTYFRKFIYIVISIWKKPTHNHQTKEIRQILNNQLWLSILKKIIKENMPFSAAKSSKHHQDVNKPEKLRRLDKYSGSR